MSNVDVVLDVVKNVLIEKHKAELAQKVHADFPLEGLNLDSLDMVELLMELEEKGHFRFDEVQAAKAVTIGDLARLATFQ